MPIFRFKGYKSNGSEAAGMVEADGPKDALLKIKELGLFPKEISLEEKIERPEASALPFVTRQLSMLIATGVPLIEALRSVSEEAGGRWRVLLTALRERVSQGASLSRAMDDYGKVFPDFYRNMVAAGEVSGSLDRALSGLADLLEKQSSVRAKAVSAMLYPAVMVFVGFAVLSFIFTFVIPKIVRIFEYTKSALPLATVILIFVSNVFVKYWWVILGFFIAGAYALRNLLRRKKIVFDRLFLKLPGGIIQSLYYTRFSLTLGFLLEGGLPVLSALELAGKSIGNLALEERVREGAKKVSEGARLSASLEGFPPVLLQLIATGEKGGRLVETLKRASDSYEEEFRRKLDRVVSLIEPLMILLMGAVVGFIVLSVLLPIFELNRIIR